MTALAWLLAATFLALAVARAISSARWGRRAAAERRVLSFLEHGDWVFGSDVIRRCQLGRGIGYVLLNDMEERGLIESRAEPNPKQGTLPRRLYRKRAEEPRHAG